MSDGDLTPRDIREVEAESGTGLIGMLLQAAKGGEDMGCFIRWYSRSIVGEREHAFAFALFGGDRHTAGLFVEGVFDPFRGISP